VWVAHSQEYHRKMSIADEKKLMLSPHAPFQCPLRPFSHLPGEFKLKISPC
jgi:hypothetical protein